MTSLPVTDGVCYLSPCLDFSSAGLFNCNSSPNSSICLNKHQLNLITVMAPNETRIYKCMDKLIVEKKQVSRKWVLYHM